MAELILELFSEEIPAGMQAKAAADLQRLMSDKLSAAGLDYTHAECHATPRRLTLFVDGVPDRSPDIREERKGPKADAPEKAIEGFLRSVGMTRDQVETRETPKGAVLFAVIEREGRMAADAIAEIVPAVIESFPWPKSMRWGDGDLRWVRPLHEIVCVLDGHLVPFTAGGIASGKITYGHRFMAPEAIGVAGWAEHKAKLEDARVILDRQKRKRRILAGAESLCDEAGLVLKDDPRLLDEVAGLVEWPVVLMGRFDAAFLKLPDEVLTAAMRGHQKYFSVRDPSTGKLANRFVTVANLKADDGGAAMTAGNERVLTARLKDAEHFWTHDKRTKLEDRLPKLDSIVFHEKLGSVGDKARRVAGLAKALAAATGADPVTAERAGLLAKTDLVTDMVGEFPELQGLMGRYYAEEEGLPPEVTQAIGDHYAPQGPNDRVPDPPTSIAVSLADKLDTLAGFWAIGEKPTGSGDPYALRRAALGVIRLCLENEVRLRLRSVFQDGEVGDDLLSFFADRLKVHLRDEGVRHDVIDAVFALKGQDDLVLIVKRAHALKDFLASEDGEALLTAYRRAANILGIEEKKDAATYREVPLPEQFQQNEEHRLFFYLEEATANALGALEREDFAHAMSSLAALRAPVDAFFDTVTVNADDPALRANRLKLLAQIVGAMDRLADFSKIEG